MQTTNKIKSLIHFCYTEMFHYLGSLKYFQIVCIQIETLIIWAKNETISQFSQNV